MSITCYSSLWLDLIQLYLKMFVTKFFKMLGKLLVFGNLAQGTSYFWSFVICCYSWKLHHLLNTSIRADSNIYSQYIKLYINFVHVMIGPNRWNMYYHSSLMPASIHVLVEELVQWKRYLSIQQSTYCSTSILNLTEMCSGWRCSQRDTYC